MFHSLRTRLTVLYGGLFGVALLTIACAVYFAITSAAGQEVDRELVSGGAVFDRIWTLRASQLEDGAGVLAHDFGFRAALATGDAATVTSALDNLRGRLKLDKAFVVGVDGKITGLDGLDERAAARLWSALDDGQTRGILQIKDMPYQAVSAPIMAPDLRGWIVFAAQIDHNELRQLEQLSAIPLSAAVLTHRASGWSGPGLSTRDTRALSDFIARSAKKHWTEPHNVGTEAGPAIALVKPLKALDGDAASVLVLRYPLALALAPYQPMLVAVLGLALAGLASLIAGSWFLARTITRPVSALDRATHQLERGEAAQVPVTTHDELGRLASSFNTMAAGIHDREQRITHMALTDQESGLPNRRAFDDALAQGGDRVVAVLGFERYAQIRAALGYHTAADMVREVGALLVSNRHGAIVARLSSERLGLLLSSTDMVAAKGEAAALLKVLEQPLRMQGATVDAAFSIGLAGLDAGEAIPAIERASIALDQARAAHRKIAAFDAEAYGDPASKLSLMSEMLDAFEDGSITQHYQPKLDMRRGVVSSAEALIRWNHPTRGMVSPDLFVTLAEETGHIRALTNWTLDRIIEDQATLRLRGIDLELAMNLSGRMVAEPGFAEHAIAKIKKAGARLCFEITETAVIGNPELAFGVIGQFRDAGIRISIDDYGSGMSSLTYLRQIPADELKIDKSFVMQLAEGGRDALLVKSTVDLAHSLGLKLVAEGVETAETLAVLTAMGCDMAQGYHVARPMPLRALDAFMTAEEPKTAAAPAPRRPAARA
jgi:EAL domain-containing protein (putative c-di-GMP-specific phosphodiesterase class I)/GGDEF domain-containing protein